MYKVNIGTIIDIYKTSIRRKGMEKIISFHISKEDKQILDDKAKEERMSLSTYCRNSILKFAVQKEQKHYIPNYEKIREVESH
jgi:hypothetical protein